MKSIDFGFLFARVLKEYGIGFDDLLQTPLRRFWFLNNQIDRLRAEKELRQLQLLASAQSGDAFKATYDHLSNQIGKIYVWDEAVSNEIVINTETGLDPEFDRNGLHALKNKNRING